MSRRLCLQRPHVHYPALLALMSSCSKARRCSNSTHPSTDAARRRPTIRMTPIPQLPNQNPGMNLLILHQVQLLTSTENTCSYHCGPLSVGEKTRLCILLSHLQGVWAPARKTFITCLPEPEWKAKEAGHRKHSCRSSEPTPHHRCSPGRSAAEAPCLPCSTTPLH